MLNENFDPSIWVKGNDMTGKNIRSLTIAVIDGQGGGIGRMITEKLRREFNESVEIYAFGTNAVATTVMLRAGANDSATGENAIVQNMDDMNLIVGSIAIVVPHSMLGELTPAMAAAVTKSKAPKLLLAINRCGVYIVGASTEPLPHLVDELIRQIKNVWEDSDV
jgi:hypothetical protein